MTQKEIFVKFVNQYCSHPKEVIEKFEEFHEILTTMNQQINLVSRKTNPDDYWVLHYLDSILPIQFIDFSGKSILDFGTGGGLPGIPLKLLFEDIKLTLLDSKKKKIKAIDGFLKKLDLKNSSAISARIEEIDVNRKYDIIVCRSVKILPKYKHKLLNLLKKGGKLILYKSRNLDDVAQFKNRKIFELEIDSLGKRSIIEIRK